MTKFFIAGILFIGIAVVFCLRLYLHPERNKKSKITALFVFAMIGIFILTDNPPVLTLTITPENPSTAKEVKILISAKDDRCLLYDFIISTGGIGSHTMTLMEYSTYPLLYCPLKKLEKVVDLSTWTEENLQKLGDEFDVSFSIKDASDQTSTIRSTVFINKK